eukprot:gnl/TRDRNA2_/TRDRNA2_176564_c4_seq10.p1 gnl/TRDRNA2_/TRDRNA2_176564_c4~~gnl/TRDRNA2_/TRDRNA2_176564_c4_seq10.p1  ORF type:complete len:609 (-),score=108.10 gnl/TRDRNA2_/TRDRNA2_176564_c4_seq10:581-2407(-)
MPASNRSTKQTRRSQHYKTMIDQDTAKGANDSQAKLINKQIIEASELCQVEQLLTVISKHVRQMNVINLSTAAHRLAKLASANDAEVNTHPVVSQLFNAVFMKVNSAEAVTIQPQAICNMTWSLAKLEFVGNPTLVHALANLTAKTIHTFKPFELSTTIWAFAKLVSTSEGNAAKKLAWSPKCLFEVVAEHIMQDKGDCGFRCLATMAWSFASVRYRKPSLFRCIAQRMKTVACEANSQEVGNTIWAFATAGFHDLQLFSILGQHALETLHVFKAQEISNMLWGCGTNGFWHEELFVRSVEAGKNMKLFPQHLANIIWGFARAQPHHPATRASVLDLLPLCTQQVSSFKPLEMSTTAFAVANVFGCQARELPTEVMNFFAAVVPLAALHVHDLSDSSLSNLASAVSMLHLNASESVKKIEAEVACRMHHLGHLMLISLLKSFAVMPNDCSSSVANLASKLLQEFDNFTDHTAQVLSQTIGELFETATGRHRASCEYLRILASCTSPCGAVEEAYVCCPLTGNKVEALNSIGDDLSTNDRSEDIASSCGSFDEGFQHVEFFDTYRVYVKNSFLHVQGQFSDEQEVRSTCERRSLSAPPMRRKNEMQLLA